GMKNMEPDEEEFAELDAYIHRVNRDAYNDLAGKIDLSARFQELLTRIDGSDCPEERQGHAEINNGVSG
ncbi:hypothetical protein, partial [Parafrankia soli]|uniref:hypothetical protein n=1 Tax=Parafrankia soli TaxID=2599596 RepID=UPI001A7E1877